MSGFDLDQLRTLVAVLDSGSLTAAAPKVFLSQSSVSEQMRKLEDRAGQPLLVRGKAGVAATPAGERLLAHARAILALSDEAYRDLRGVALRGELRLCITDYFRPGDVARMLRRLNEQYPQVRLHVTIMKSGAIEAAYERGEIDVGISMSIQERGAPRARAQGACCAANRCYGWRRKGRAHKRASPCRCWCCPRRAPCASTSNGCCRAGACPMRWRMWPLAWRVCSWPFRLAWVSPA